ncbi:hypothetical protein CSUI_011552, partial [Cystoisospora suis]
MERRRQALDDEMTPRGGYHHQQYRGMEAGEQQHAGQTRPRREEIVRADEYGRRTATEGGGGTRSTYWSGGSAGTTDRG